MSILKKNLKLKMLKVESCLSETANLQYKAFGWIGEKKRSGQHAVFCARPIACLLATKAMAAMTAHVLHLTRTFGAR